MLAFSQLTGDNSGKKNLSHFWSQHQSNFLKKYLFEINRWLISLQNKSKLRQISRKCLESWRCFKTLKLTVHIKKIDTLKILFIFFIYFSQQYWYFKWIKTRLGMGSCLQFFQCHNDSDRKQTWFEVVRKSGTSVENICWNSWNICYSIL